jgi:stearoyl-CoA desaturase (delta-9 desaturase)
MNESKSNLIHQALFYISATAFILSIFSIPYVTLMAVLYGWAAGTIVVSCYYHRYLSHRSWNCPRWLEWVLLLLGAGHGFLPAFSWVNIHHRHHRYTDTDKDPHGPQLSIFKNLNIATNLINVRYVTRSLYEDKLVMFQINHYWKILIVYFILWSYFFGPAIWFIINGYVFLMLVVVNMIGHRVGQGPVNLIVTPIFLSGETYHKNHHDNPRAAKFGTFDPGWWFIRLFQRA